MADGHGNTRCAQSQRKKVKLAVGSCRVGSDRRADARNDDRENKQGNLKDVQRAPKKQKPNDEARKPRRVPPETPAIVSLGDLARIRKPKSTPGKLSSVRPTR
jgi:hypothetical protein